MCASILVLQGSYSFVRTEVVVFALMRNPMSLVPMGQSVLGASLNIVPYESQ